MFHYLTAVIFVCSVVSVVKDKGKEAAKNPSEERFFGKV